MRKLFYKLNKLIIKYFGFILYPTNKQGKEDKNKKIQGYYK